MEGGRDSGLSADGMEGRVGALQALRQLLALDDRDLTTLYDAYLETARNVFGLRIGIIGTLLGDYMQVDRVRSELPVAFADGQTAPLAETCAESVVRSGKSLFLHEGEAPYGTCIVAPIRVGGEITGAIALLDPEPDATAFDEEARAFMELLTATLGQAITRNRLEESRRAAELERRDATALFSTVFANAPIGEFVVGLDGRLMRVNAAACRFLGYSEAALMAMDFQAITYAPDLLADLHHVEALLAGSAKDYEMEKRYVRSTGEVVWAQLNVSIVTHDDGSPRCFISQIQDINQQRALIEELDLRRRELEEANQKLLALAALDPLTGTLNRRALRQRLDEEMASAVKHDTPLAFVMVDVDHFKAYNDRHGHLHGDNALKQVAQCLKGAARASDTIGRFGGEEFMLLLPQTGEADACKVAERLRERIANSKDLRWPLTVSAGVHVFQPEGKLIPVDQPIAKADVALYRAKRLGRNRVEMA